MRLVFAGTPDAAVPAFTCLLASRHQVLAVVTRPPARSGRGRPVTPSPVALAADAAGVPVLTPGSPREPAFLAELTALAPDCCPVVAYGALVPPAALSVPARGWVNLHFSVLPAWRGAAPVQHALLAGDDVTGATTFRLDEGLDTGPLYGVVTESIRSTDTSGDLLARLAASGAGLLVATLDGIEDGTLRPVPQPAEGVSYAPKLGAHDAQVNWAAPGLAVDRLVRAATPAPGAWSVLRGERIKISPVVVPPPDVPVPVLAPGELAVGRDRVVVGTGSRPVLLGQVLAPGRRAMPAVQWARGVRLQPGERFDAGPGRTGERSQR